MKKKDEGFTLIELIIAIAVLSLMASVLFQTFAVSGKINAKSGRQEAVLDMAKKTMEELKGYSFEKLDILSQKEQVGKVDIAGTQYTYEPLPAGSELVERQGYLLKREYKKDGNDKTDYLVYGEADWGVYNLEAEDTPYSVYSINSYQMPNIADVSSFQNVVIDPAMLTKDDTIQVEKLLAKVNPPEAESGGAGTENPIYKEDDIHRYLQVDLSEKDGNKLIVKVKKIDTVSTEVPSKAEEFKEEMTIISSLVSLKKEIVRDEKIDKTVNRIYLFLPKTVNYEKIYVNADVNEVYELYAIASSTDGLKRKDYIVGDFSTGSGVELYTNLEDDNPVSLYEAEKRLYHLTVTVYEAEYAEGNPTPGMGKEVLKLDSTKSE